MQFEKTETFLNLAKSFAGESQAGMRYQLIAQTAMQEGLKTLSDEIKKIAKNETVHARRFFETLAEKGGAKDKIAFDADFPFHTGSLEEMLHFAAKDEKAESTEIYPEFALTAEKEGFKDVAALWNKIGEVEKSHRVIFDYLYNAVKDGTLYVSNKPELWVCSECGHQGVSTEAWKTCPLCQMKQGYVELHLPYEGVKI